MNKKNKTILIFIDWFLPGYKAGGPITSVANIISHLQNDYNFKIITTDTDYLEKEPYKNIESNKWTKYSENISIYYFSKAQISIKNIKNIIKKTYFDIAYINGIYSFYFSIIPLYYTKKFRKNVPQLSKLEKNVPQLSKFEKENNKPTRRVVVQGEKKIIVASRGMLSEHAFSRKSKKKKLFLQIVKILGLYKNIIFHATNNDEAKSIEKTIKFKQEIKILPNLPRKYKKTEQNKKIKKTGELKLVSIARISKEKNTLFALEKLQQITAGKIEFDLYGSIYDKEYWNKCLEIINKLPKNIKVTHRGTVRSEKVIETFAKYDFAFMPSLGENFGHSILECFMAGTPVITSNNTPWKGLENKKIGWDIDLQNKEKFKQVINFCIEIQQVNYIKFVKKTIEFGEKITTNKDNINSYYELF